MPKTPVLVQVVVDYSPAGPKVIRATDDLANDKKFRTRGQASADLLRQVMNKLIDNRQTGANIILTLDDSGFIIPDTAVAVESHLDAVRSAANAMNESLNALSGAISDETKKKKTTKKSSRSAPKKKQPPRP